MLKVAIVLGSKSDFDKVKPAIEIFDKFGVPYEARILSAHRTPEEAGEFARNAKVNGFGAIIAVAGKAAHLGGGLAADDAALTEKYEKYVDDMRQKTLADDRELQKQLGK